MNKSFGQKNPDSKITGARDPKGTPTAHATWQRADKSRDSLDALVGNLYSAFLELQARQHSLDTKAGIARARQRRQSLAEKANARGD